MEKKGGGDHGNAAAGGETVVQLGKLLQLVTFL